MVKKTIKKTIDLAVLAADVTEMQKEIDRLNLLIKKLSDKVDSIELNGYSDDESEDYND